MTLATETLALQRANGAGPGMSLLPALVQAPFFMIMFRLVRPGSGTPSGLLSGDLFGVPLTAHLAGGLPIFAVLIALTAALATWSSRRTRKSMAAAQVAQASSAAIVPAKTARSSAASTAASAASTAPSAAEAAGPLIGRMMTFLPFVTVLTVAYLPLAGALCLVTSTAWTALETALWRRPVQAGNR
jgi:YidC/Oxa1 family membrane protein insertase